MRKIGSWMASVGHVGLFGLPYWQPMIDYKVDEYRRFNYRTIFVEWEMMRTIGSWFVSTQSIDAYLIPYRLPIINYKAISSIYSTNFPYDWKYFSPKNNNADHVVHFVVCHPVEAQLGSPFPIMSSVIRCQLVSFEFWRENQMLTIKTGLCQKCRLCNSLIFSVDISRIFSCLDCLTWLALRGDRIGDVGIREAAIGEHQEKYGAPEEIGSR